MQTLPKTIWKGYYFDGRSAGRQNVAISVMRGGLHIEGEDGSTLWWPYDQIRQTQGFYAGEPVRLEKGEDISEALVVMDGAFLTAIFRVAPDVQARFRGPLQRSVWLQRALLAGVAVIIVGTAFYLWGLPALTDAAAARVPASWEEQLGQVVLEHLTPPDRRCTDPARIKLLDRIVSTLTASGPPSPYTFRITVVKDPAVNAFAAPGGHIVVYEGLLRKTKTPEELAGVLAHEMQHVLHRHPIKALLREMSMSALMAVLTGDSKGLSYALSTAETLGGLRYRRRDEEAADRAGMKMIQAARVDPAGMIDFFITLDKEALDMPGGLKYLSTHPPTEDRIEQLKRLAAQARYTPIPLLPDYPWVEIQKICDAGSAP